MKRGNFIVKFSGRLAFVHKVYGLAVNWDIASALTNEQLFHNEPKIRTNFCYTLTPLTATNIQSSSVNKVDFP